MVQESLRRHHLIPKTIGPNENSYGGCHSRTYLSVGFQALIQIETVRIASWQDAVVDSRISGEGAREDV